MQNVATRTRSAWLGILLLATACGGSGGGSGGGSAGGASAQADATLALTDAPSDELSLLEVELVDVSLIDGAGQATSVFPGPGGGSLRVNLLRLRGIDRLLATSALPAGSYGRAELSYRDARALDTAGNALSVTPAAGKAIAVLSPAVVVPFAHRFIELDFDVDASVQSLRTGPGGSLQLSPVLMARVHGAGDRGLDDFTARVTAVGPNHLEVALGAGTVRVELLPAARVVSPNGQVSTPGAPGFDLTTLVPVGALAEITGRYDVAARLVRASEVALEDGPSGRGPGFGGVVLALGADRFELLVLDPRDSGLAPGAVTPVSLAPSTGFSYDDFPAAVASATSLAPGQEVRVLGSPGAAATAVRLRQTKLRGTITAVDAARNRLTVTAASFEGVAVSRLTGFQNPVTVQLDGPAGLTVGGRVELEGQWNRTAPGVFDVPALAARADDDAELEGRQYTPGSAAPLSFTLTGDGGLLGSPLTATVRLAPGAVLVERDRAGLTTPVSEADLAAGIAAGRYEELKVEGAWDAASSTLTATKVRADLN